MRNEEGIGGGEEQDEQGSNSGPVINEESNFPSWRLDELEVHGSYYSMRDGAQEDEGEGTRGVNGWGIHCVQVDAQLGGRTTRKG